MAYETDTDTDHSDAQKIGHTVAEISEKASVLVREEIELAKAEVSQKVKSLSRGAIVAIAAGIFAVLGLIFLLHTLSWLFYWLLIEDSAEIFWGFLITSGILFFFTAVAAMIGIRWIKKGAPPTPDMAIDEAKRIKETVSS
jgi:uncharacterized small protein (DUF1192 family)